VSVASTSCTGLTSFSFSFRLSTLFFRAEI